MPQQWDHNREVLPTGPPLSDDDASVTARGAGEVAVSATTPALSTPRAASVMPQIAAQRRSRRLRYLAGLALIVVPGSLWAGLTKDASRQRGFDQFAGGPNGMIVDAVGPMRPAMPIPIMADEIDLVSGEEITLSRPLDQISQVRFGLDEGDQLVVTLAASADDLLADYRPVVYFLVFGPDGFVGVEHSLIVPGPDDDSDALEFIAESSGEHTLEVSGDFAPFEVEVTIARNPVVDADGTTDGEG